MKIVLTCGDCNGIGPEIIVKALHHFAVQRASALSFSVVIPENVYEQAIQLCSSSADFSADKLSDVTVISPGELETDYGKVTAESGKIAGEAIRVAVDLLLAGDADAMVTAPLNKEALHLRGFNYPGHTEYISALCGAKPGKMMFVGKGFNAGLVTIHTPLKEVPDLITAGLLEETFDSFLNTLKNDFSVENPKIAVLGLNPHAGENGQIGSEEKEILIPVLEKFRESVFGPFPADAFFGRQLFRKYHLTLGMYHDQILAPFKLLHPNTGVNFTSGLPVIRTSPDHGTGFDIAGKGTANPDSFIEAIECAVLLAERRNGKK